MAPVSTMTMGHHPHIPPNLSREQSNHYYARYEQMKQDGVDQRNPEFIKLHNWARGLTARYHTLDQQRKKSATLSHQQQLREQQQAVNGQHAVNGVNGQMPNGVSTQPSLQPSGIHQPTAPSSATAPATTQHVADWDSITADRAATLRDQILAYRMLGRNLPVPTSIQQRLFKAKIVPRPTQSKTEAADNDKQTLPLHFTTFIPPHDRLPRDGTISSYDHARRQTRPYVPSLLPSGIDVRRVREEEEKAKHSRLMARLEELENMPANVATWDTHSSDTPTPDHRLKFDTLIEYRKLRTLQKQRDLRQKIQRDLLHYDNLAQTANRAMYRRAKKISLDDTRVTRKLENEQRQARDAKEKTKQNDQLAAIQQHAREIIEGGRTSRGRGGRSGRTLGEQHRAIEKEEQKRMERTAKQRLQALKNDDEATYLKLLGQAKDSRITHLLKQTDGFLKQLATSVKDQQRSAVHRYQQGQMPEEDSESSEDEDEDDDDEKEPKVDYYGVAHRIKEEVTRQANILVGGTLKEYQVKGLQWMISLYNNNLNGILADEMGLGKTIQTISLITYLIEKKQQRGPYLVIVPLSTITNWNMEFEKWAPSVRRITYKGTPPQRKTLQGQIRQGNFQVLLTTYEYIIKDKNLLAKIKWLHMVVDEGHRMKNANSKLSSTLTQYYHTRYRLILTGTPLQNNLPELWALLNFVLPTIFKSVKSFDEWFNTPFANTGGQDRMDLTEEEQLLVIRRLHKVLRPFLLRRLKKDVEKDLPEKQERVIKCKFSALQTRIYKQLCTHASIAVEDKKGGKTGIRGLTNMLMQLRKLCNHPFVFEQVEDQINPSKMTDDTIWRTAGKFELLDRILPKFQATGHRVLMFFQMTQIMNIMEDYMRLRGMKYLRLDGSTKADDRSDLLREFNAPDSPYFCFLLSTRAGGLGLNLQTADTVIIFDSDWNPHQDLQAQDRAHRIGQKNEVRILRLISSNSVEEKILERARFKLDMDGKVIQAGKFDNKSTVEERETFLRTLLEVQDPTEAGDGQEEMDDDDLNVNMARSEDELVLFQQMDAERLEKSTYGPNKKFGRLMEDKELPDIYLNEDNPVQEAEEEYAGRGARARASVRYDDGLTEEQWLNAVDDDEDTIEAAQARKQARIDKRQHNKERRARLASGLPADSSPDLASRASSEEAAPPPPTKGKRGGRKSAGTKRKAVEEEPAAAAPEPPKKKRGRQPLPKVPETMSATDRATFTRVATRVLEHVLALEDDFAPGEAPTSDSDDSDSPPPRRLIRGPFVELPDRRLYGDYYLLIKTLVCLADVERKIKRREYQTLRELVTDFRQLAGNARCYNEDGSVLYADACRIENEAVAKLRSETASLGPAWQDFDVPRFKVFPPNPEGPYPEGATMPMSDDDAVGTGADGATVSGSAAAAPAAVAPAAAAAGPASIPSAPPSAGGTKLKLTFNAGQAGGSAGSPAAAPAANSGDVEMTDGD